MTRVENAEAGAVRWTNVATGDFVTVVGSYRGGDLRVTDNGDGTLTVISKHTDNWATYDQDGTGIAGARRAGLTSFELLFDNAGTPTDPSDDEFVAFLGVVTRPAWRGSDGGNVVRRGRSGYRLGREGEAHESAKDASLGTPSSRHERGSRLIRMRFVCGRNQDGWSAHRCR
jgi:hypothetical protein